MQVTTLYERLGVETSAGTDALRHAYRTLVKQWHPDHFGGDPGGEARAQRQMVLLNEAWTVLSDPQRRARYDSTLRRSDPGPSAARRRDAARRADGAHRRSDRPATPPSRKWAWFAGVRLQMVRVSTEAARSAALALALRRRGQPRAVYDSQIDAIVGSVASDVAERVRAARAAGAAPLDLGLAAALIGLRVHAGRLRRAGERSGWTVTRRAQAEMVDRMWDTMAHGISHELAVTLGGNPHLSRH